VKPGLRSGFAYVYDDDVAADIKAGRLVRLLEKGCRPFPATISITAKSAAGAACIHGTHRSTLLQIPAEEWKTICGRQQQPPVAATVVSALLVASTDDISESQFSGATLISRIAR
jgi:hypothetical protein